MSDDVIQSKLAPVCGVMQVAANNGASVQVWVRPETLGSIPIMVKATSVAAADAMQLPLLVEVVFTVLIAQYDCSCTFLATNSHNAMAFYNFWLE